MKSIWKKLTWLFFLLGAFLVACTGGTAEPAAPTVAPTSPPEQPTLNREPATATPAASPTAVEPAATEPVAAEEAAPVAAKPKLVEFYADW